MSESGGNDKEKNILANRYELIKRVAEGGMGIVYLAYDLQLQKKVAIKILHQSLNNSQKALDMLRREAKLCLELTHPNIVRLYNLELGSGGDDIFLVMEYIDGEDLYEIIQRKHKFTLQEALPMIRSLLVGLAAAHAEGIVHLDIKPENLLIKSDGTLKITDFGIARVFSESVDVSTLTSTRRKTHLAGTLLYMSPEQITRSHEIGPWTDIYASGCVIYEMLTGLPPFYGDPDIRQTKITKDVPPISGIPDGFNRILSKMLARRVEDRYQSVREILHDLTLFEADVDDEEEEKKAEPHRFDHTTAASPSVAGVLDEDMELSAEVASLRRRNWIAGVLVGIFVAIVIYIVMALGIFSHKKGVKIIQGTTTTPKDITKAQIGMETIYVPGGWFWMGSKKGKKDEKPKKVFVSPFNIDKFEVTVGEYRKCVKAGVCSKPANVKDCMPLDGPGEYPANCINWFQAQTFCKWRGGDLPTEAEWEFAARGKKGRTYPWGEKSPSCKRAVIFHKSAGCGTGKPMKVGSKPAGKSVFGIMDMSGNLSEWTKDWYAPRRTVGQVKNPQGPETGKFKVIKGGGYTMRPRNRLLKSYSRDKRIPFYFSPDLGVRCRYEVDTESK